MRTGLNSKGFSRINGSKWADRVVELAQLAGKLPAGAQSMIIGIKDPAEAWVQLDKQYGTGR